MAEFRPPTTKREELEALVDLLAALLVDEPAARQETRSVDAVVGNSFAGEPSKERVGTRQDSRTESQPQEAREPRSQTPESKRGSELSPPASNDLLGYLRAAIAEALQDALCQRHGLPPTFSDSGEDSASAARVAREREAILGFLQPVIASVLAEYPPARVPDNLDTAAAPPALQDRLAAAPIAPIERARMGRSRPISKGLIGALAILGIVGALLWGTGRRVERQVERAIDGVPSLASYDLTPRVRGVTAYLQGTLPSDRLRVRARDVAREALPRIFKLEDVTTVARRDPEEVVAEVSRLLAAANRSDGVELVGDYQDGIVALEGRVRRLQDRERVMGAIVADLEAIPGVTAVKNGARVELAHIATRVYFAPDSSRVSPRDVSGKIFPLEALLARNPSLQLRVVGYRHPAERSRASSGRSLALERALAVKSILADRGFDRRRLQAVEREGAPPDIASGQDAWLNRCVLFEIVRDELGS